ncbi:MAG: hypothetical protein V7642_3141, partial [Burkholderiales bacterium]
PNPPGSPGNGPPAVVRGGAEPALPKHRYDASPCLAFDRFPGLRACQKDTEQALRVCCDYLPGNRRAAAWSRQWSCRTRKDVCCGILFRERQTP